MHRLKLVPLLLIVLLTLSTGSTADATTERESRIRQAVTRVFDGSYTAADLALIRRHPAIASQVPDPEGKVETGVSRGRDVSAFARGRCGHWVDVWFKKESLLGRTLYVFHHRVSYCRTSSRITKWMYRYDYLTDVAAVIYIRERTLNRQDGLGTGAAWSQIQRHLEYCVARVGCYANTYPWSKIWVYDWGGYHYEGDNG